MATYLFQRLTRQAAKAEVELSDAKESVKWYRDTASRITSRDLNVNKFTQSSKERFITTSKINPSFIGKMLLFNYDPKHKETLPYYDTYPLVFPIELYSDGFLGINMHYLPPMHRARLMDALYTTINTKEKNEKTRLRISYEILNNAAKFSLFKPCVKRYLYRHIRSRFFLVDTKEWDMTLMLPLQRFTGDKISNIYRDSLKKV